MISNFTLVALLGLTASVSGVVSAFFMKRAAARPVEDQEALNALQLLYGVPIDDHTERTGEHIPEAENVSPAAADLTERILRHGRASRSDMEWGARLLVLAFILLVAQSVAMFFGGTSGGN